MTDADYDAGWRAGHDGFVEDYENRSASYVRGYADGFGTFLAEERRASDEH